MKILINGVAITIFTQPRRPFSPTRFGRPPFSIVIGVTNWSGAFYYNHFEYTRRDGNSVSLWSPLTDLASAQRIQHCVAGLTSINGLTGGEYFNRYFVNNIVAVETNFDPVEFIRGLPFPP